MMAPSLGLVQQVVNSLGAARLWDGTPALDTLSRLLKTLDDESASQLGSTLGEVLPLLRSDPDRLRLGVDLVRRADLYEAWEGLAAMMRNRQATADVLIAAAGLARHPGVPTLLSELLEMSLNGAELQQWQRRLISLRLNPEAHPDSEIERVAAGEQWPSESWRSGDAPIVAIDSSAGTPQECLSLAWDLSDLGCLVRRIPASVAKNVIDAGWLANWVPVVAANAHSASPALRLLNHGVLVETAGRLDEAARRRVLRTVNQLLPPGSGFVRTPVDRMPDAGAAPTAEMTPAFMGGGSHTRLEVAFLSGARRSDLTEFAKLPELRPRTVRGQYYWSFSQLVAVRTWRYFRSVSPGPVGRRVASKLVQIAQSEDAVLVGVTQGGRVLAYDREGDLVDVESGQTASEKVFTFADELFRPFELGGGQLAPDLLAPSRHTRVNPLVAGGTPVIGGSRVPALAVHQMLTDVRQSHSTQSSLDIVLKEYPELTPHAINDADKLARSVLAVR